MRAGKWLILGLAAAAVHGGGPALDVRGGASAAQQAEVRALVLRLEDVVNTLCRSTDEPVPLTFVLGAGEGRLARDPGCVLPLLRADPLLRHTDIVRGLLYRRALKWVAPPALTPEHVPGWLVAAVYYRSVTDGTPATADTYAISRQLAAANRIPDPEQLVEHPASPDNPLFFALYAEVADVLLRVLQRTDPLAANQVLRRLDPQPRPWASLRPLIPEKNDAQVPAWFAERFRQVSDGTRTLQTVDEVLARVRELETLKLPGATPGAPARAVLWDELPAAAPGYRPEPQEPERRLDQCYRLLVEAPPLLKAPVTEYVKAFALLVEGKDAAFRKRLGNARRQLAAAAEHAARLRAYLDELERIRVAPGQRLAGYQRLIEAPVHPLEFDRALERYLDELTRRLEPEPGERLPPAAE